MVFYQHWKIVRQRRNASTTYAYQCATALILFVSISMVRRHSSLSVAF